MKEKKKLYIVGAGGFGREVIWLVERINENDEIWELMGLIDDNIDLKGSIIGGYNVIGDCNSFANILDEVYVVVAIGNPSTKKKIVEKLANYKNIRFATLIDPSVQMSKKITVGEGTIICAGSILTTDIRIGKNVIINLDCTVGHDAVISDYVTVYPSANISGYVDIGDMSEIGTGSNIIQGIKICSKTILGAGTVVVKDIPGSGVYVGCPASLLKKV